MKRNIKYLFFLFLCLVGFPASKVAASAYTVSVVSSSGSEQSIGNYDNYDTARSVMMNHNSDANNVAVVKENGEIINAKYGIVHLAYNKNNPTGEGTGDNEHRLFPSESASTAHTTVHAAYGNDAAFLDYNATYRRAKIKISGYTGWINRGYYTIIPISRLQGTSAWIASKDSSWVSEISANTIKVVSSTPINLRSGPGTVNSVVGAAYSGNTYTYTEKTQSGGYTWYKIGGSPIKTYYENYAKTGCLIHYYATYNSQGYTNLGKAPTFLNSGAQYYSFDGNYYYTNLTTMLDDYRENGHNRAVNKDNPYYPYYLYLSNHSRTRYTANDFNQGIINKGFYNSAQSKMYGQGDNFILSQERYGVNALITFSAAINESASGTSAIAMHKNNLFGHNAYGKDPFANATTYATVADGIMAHASMTGNGYNNPADNRYYGGHYGNKQSGMNVKYATDPYWGEKAAQNAFLTDNSFGLQEFNGNTIGVKQSTEAVPVRKRPDDNASTIYYLKNNGTGVANMPIMVTDKVYSGGKAWYKVRTDVALNDNQDIADVTYSFDKSYGYIEESKLYVANKQPIIVASDRTVNKGENIDLMNGVIATDPENGNITSSVTISGEVYINIPGDYKITYTATDNQQFSVSKTITVTVKGESIPEIHASNQTVTQYTTFNPKNSVSANDGIDGDITSRIEVIQNTVDINKVGTYKVIYKVTNSTGKSTTKEITITVKANEKPVINANDKSIAQNSTFDPLDDVSASDAEDGSISNIEVTENTVDTSKLGTYKVTYKVKDNAGQETTKTISIKVEEKVLEQKDYEYYFDSMHIKEDILTFKGFLIIKGIHNQKDENIQYNLILEDSQGKKITKTLKRITNKQDMPFQIESEDNFDYTYAWFTSNINLKDIPQNDYKLSVEAKTDTYYATTYVTNLFGATMKAEKSSRSYYLRNNYDSPNTELQLFIRNNSLGEKNVGPNYNIYNSYEKLTFTNNQLRILGTSHSIGGDYSVSAKVSRTIIFENIATFKQYKFSNIESITNGPYEVELASSDGYNKTRAWFDAKLDVGALEKGTYAIQIATVTNLSDVGELQDIFANKIDLTFQINNKKYSFKIDEENRYRILMTVS